MFPRRVPSGASRATVGLSLLLGLLLTLALAGCFGPTRQVLSSAPEPSATVLEMSARSFDRQRADLTLRLEVDNPGAPLAVTSADYELLAQGRSFAVGTVALQVPVPERGRAALTLPLKLAYLDLPYAARNLFRAGEPVQLVARGTLRGAAGLAPAAIEFDGEAAIGLTFGPDDP